MEVTETPGTDNSSSETSMGYGVRKGNVRAEPAVVHSHSETQR